MMFLNNDDEWAEITDLEAPKDLDEVHRYLDEIIYLQEQKEQLESTLKIVAGRLRRLEIELVPEYLDEHQISRLEHRHYQVEVRDRYEGNLPKDPQARERAIAYLDEAGAGDIIKVDVDLSFPRGERNRAQGLVRELEEQGYHAQVSEGVHASTLKSFCRQQHEDGTSFDPTRVGVFHLRQTKLKPAKK